MKRTTFVLSGAAVIGALPAATLADGAIGGGVVETQNRATSVKLAGTAERAAQNAPQGQILFGGTCDLYDNGGPDGVNGYSNGTVENFGARRTILDDFDVANGQVWTITQFGHQHVWNLGNPGDGTGMELNLYSDSAGSPAKLLQALAVTNYVESGTGETFFNRPAAQSWTTFEEIVLEPATYWIEGAVMGPENNFWLTAPVNGSPCWINYEVLTEGEPRPGRSQFGVDADMSWCLSGTADFSGPTFAFGLEHVPTGQAQLDRDAENNTLTIGNIGSSGDDGVSVSLGDTADGWLGNGSIAADPAEGAVFGLNVEGTRGGTPDLPVGGVTITAGTSSYAIAPNLNVLGATTYSLTLRNGGEEVFSQSGIPAGIDFIEVNFGETLAASFAARTSDVTDVTFTLSTAAPVTVSLLPGDEVADELEITADDASETVQAVTGANLTFGDTGDVTLDDEALRQFDLDHRTLGTDVRFHASGGLLTLTLIGDSGDDGYTIDPPDLDSFVASSAPFGVVVPPAKFINEATGVLDGAASGSGSLGVGGLQNLGGLLGGVANFTAIGSDQVRVQIYDDGELVGESVETANPIRIVLIIDVGEGVPLINGYGVLPDIAFGYTFTFDRNASFRPNSGGDFEGDELRMLAEDPDGSVRCLDGFTATAAVSPVIVVNNEAITEGDCGGGGGCPCPGDADGNCVVDFADILVILGNWGGSGAGDLDNSGVVDFADVLIVLGDWGCVG